MTRKDKMNLLKLAWLIFCTWFFCWLAGKAGSFAAMVVLVGAGALR